MTRTFLHSFEPIASSPVSGATVDLQVSEIEDAGVFEVLQTPGAGFGAWSFLDALLTPGGAGAPFLFKEPLGQAREVKVALSGLFGRFVARAYLQRYFNLSIFAHLSGPSLILDARRRMRVKRLARGDLPDWVACAADLSSLTVAEAKGCHDPGGPAKALKRAWAQAGRIDVTAGGRKVTVKRIAIATRWGMAVDGPADAHLAVRDPVDNGQSLDAEDQDALFVGLLRVHIANLIGPVGHGELADALRGLTLLPLVRTLQDAVPLALSLLDAAPIRDEGIARPMSALVGGVVTRSGPIPERAISVADEEVLDRLNLRPIFVGIERDLVRAAIEGDAQAIRARIDGVPVHIDRTARTDRIGGWIIRLGSASRAAGNE
jgi:hypothetical protein